MKKITTVLTASLFALFSATAMACPQGTTLTGGKGANHKGGKCVSITNVKTQTKQNLSKSKADLNKVDAKNVQALKQDQKTTKQNSKSALKIVNEKAHIAKVSAQKAVDHAQQAHKATHS